MSIFDESTINPFMSDDEILASIIERIAKNPEEFKKVSDRAIELGLVERLTETGYSQAVQNVAHKVFMLSLGMNLTGIPMEQDSNEYYNYDGVGDEMKQLDKIINMIAFASGKHWNYVNADIDKWLDYYAEKFGEDIKNLQ